jgi:hypothetical protein
LKQIRQTIKNNIYLKETKHTIKMIFTQSDNSSQHVFGFNTSRIVRLNAAWWVENMNPEIGSYRLLDVSLLAYH